MKHELRETLPKQQFECEQLSNAEPLVFSEETTQLIEDEIFIFVFQKANGFSFKTQTKVPNIFLFSKRNKQPSASPQSYANDALQKVLCPLSQLWHVALGSRFVAAIRIDFQVDVVGGQLANQRAQQADQVRLPDQRREAAHELGAGRVRAEQRARRRRRLDLGRNARRQRVAQHAAPAR